MIPKKTLVLASLLCLSYLQMDAQQKKQPVDFVDNFIGVRDENTSCVLGPQLPNGTIIPSPHTALGKVMGYGLLCNGKSYSGFWAIT
jgi:putative alpha-1,2-mannosidase